MVRCFKLIHFAILAFLLLPCIVQVLTKKERQRTSDQIERFVQQFCRCKDIKGLTISVVRNEDILMTKAFGYKNLETKEKADENTLFGIASLSKAFAAATLVKILSEKNITLATPLNEFLNITFPNEQLNAYVTLEDLLSHRTGLIPNNYLRFNPNFTRRNLDKFLKHFHVHQDFRTGFIYNNVMYGLASYITELLTNTTWEEAVTTQLLRPLGMSKTTFSTTADDNLDRAHPYLKSGKDYRRISSEFTKKWAELGGSGSILSNAVDMTRWMRFLLNEGELHGKHIMDSKDIQDIFKARNHLSSRTTFMRPKIPITVSTNLYTLGWKKGYYRGFPMITHTGSTFGYKAMLTLFPVQRLGIFSAQIGSDNNYIKRRLLHSYIADLYLGEKPWLNQINACVFPARSSTKKTVVRKRETLTSPILNTRYDFAGNYFNRLWGDLRIEMTRTGLKMIYGYASFMLSPTRNPLVFKAVGMEDIWFIKLSTVKFEIDKNEKRVVSVTPVSFEKYKPPTFDKVKQ